MKPEIDHAPVKTRLSLLLTLIAAILLFRSPADAFFYDNFNSGNSIDADRWQTASPPTCFIQKNGRLYFSATKSNDSIRSIGSFGPGFFSVEFHDYSSTNLEPAGSHRGAFAALGLGPKDNFARIIRCQNGVPKTPGSPLEPFGVFEANFVLKGSIQVHYVPTDVAQGQLGLYYDGLKVSFYYNRGLDPDAGWQKILPDCVPGWNSDPTLFLRGSDPTGATSFSLDNLRYREGWRPAP